MTEITNTLAWMANLFLVFVGLGVLAIGIVYVVDRTQKTQAVRRNFPVIGRFRYLFEHLGEFFRQYFFAQDREEMPFNRAQRAWVYRASKGVDSTISFGSTRTLTEVGTELFVNSAYPTLDTHAKPASPQIIGPNCKHPYQTNSIFNISGMSFGAISKPAVIALSEGAKQAGIWMNTGEGGLSPYHLQGGADIVFQIGTAKYGVRDSNGNLSAKALSEIASHEQVKMFEIKLAQGAKPGKGGILPGAKVTAEIATIRKIEIGQDSLSPNRHPEIECADDLLDMINMVRDITGKPVGFKTVFGDFDWLGELFTKIRQRGSASAPDFITIDSADGGTGAAPMSLMDYMGIPVKESLPVVVDMLHEHGLRNRIKVIASGKLITPAHAAWAMCAGADFVTSARGFMFALGCIQALQCGKNTCPTGITTHNKKLQRGLDPTSKAVRVCSYSQKMHYELGVIAHSCGVVEPRQLTRKHCRQVVENGRSIPLSELYPSVVTATEPHVASGG